MDIRALEDKIIGLEQKLAEQERRHACIAKDYERRLAKLELRWKETTKTMGGMLDRETWRSENMVKMMNAIGEIKAWEKLIHELYMDKSPGAQGDMIDLWRKFGVDDPTFEARYKNSGLESKPQSKP